jgi:AraC-like DNA-binding protein
MYFIKTEPEVLKKEIKFFYSLIMKNVPDDLASHRRLPDGTLDIVLNLKKPIYISKDGNRFEQMPPAAITGLYTDKCILKYEDEIAVVCAVLQPGYAHLLINDNLAHHRSATGDAGQVFGSGLQALQERMHVIVDEKEKHRLFEKFLLSRIRTARDSYSIAAIENVIATIHKRSGAISINNLCKEHFIGERNLRRKFIEYVGISPKKYAAIIRMKSFCSLLGRGMDYDHCINNLDFTDRSHLHKEFIKIAGISPDRYFRQTNVISEKFLQFV